MFDDHSITLPCPFCREILSDPIPGKNAEENECGIASCLECVQNFSIIRNGDNGTWRVSGNLTPIPVPKPAPAPVPAPALVPALVPALALAHVPVPAPVPAHVPMHVPVPEPEPVLLCPGKCGGPLNTKKLLIGRGTEGLVCCTKCNLEVTLCLDIYGIPREVIRTRKFTRMA